MAETDRPEEVPTPVTAFTLNKVRYRDFDDVEREMDDPTHPWYGERGALKALGRTKEGVEAMLALMEDCRAAS